MFICPYCKYPLIGKAPTKTLTPDSKEVTITCTHCWAILRVEITTLKPPDEKKLNANKIKEKDGN